LLLDTLNAVKSAAIALTDYLHQPRWFVWLANVLSLAAGSMAAFMVQSASSERARRIRTKDLVKRLQKALEIELEDINKQIPLVARNLAGANALADVMQHLHNVGAGKPLAGVDFHSGEAYAKLMRGAAHNAMIGTAYARQLVQALLSEPSRLPPDLVVGLGQLEAAAAVLGHAQGRASDIANRFAEAQITVSRKARDLESLYRADEETGDGRFGTLLLIHQGAQKSQLVDLKKYSSVVESVMTTARRFSGD